MGLSTVNKAIAGAATTTAVVGLGQATGIVQIIPPDVSAPWWGYIVVYAITAIAGFAGVYIAPKNTN